MCWQTYDKEEALRLNDVVEILGIKSTVPELASLHMSPQEGDAKTDFMEEDMAAKPPTSLASISEISLCVLPFHK